MKKGTKKAVRARPSNAVTASMADNSQVAMEVPREDKRKAKRPARVPMVAGVKLGIPNMDLENYHYAWIQDQKGQIESALAAWYEFHMVDGQKYVRASGAFPLYAMKLARQYKEEDDELKHKQTLGTLQKQQILAPGEYVPGAEEGRTHVLEKDDDYDPLG